MTYWTYRKVNRDAGDPASYLVYVDNRYMGEVYVVRGGWAFYDRDRHLTSFATSRDEAVRTGLRAEWG